MTSRVSVIGLITANKVRSLFGVRVGGNGPDGLL
jgi:hypothetical protein